MAHFVPNRCQTPKALYRTSPELKALGHTARGFFEMIRKHDAAAWPGWLEAAMHSPLASFGRRLERDRNAVDAALRFHGATAWCKDRSTG
jgi:transposase